MNSYVSSAGNFLGGIEHLTDEELQEIRTKCEQRAKDHKDDDQGGDDFVQRAGDKVRTAAKRAVAAE